MNINAATMRQSYGVIEEKMNEFNQKGATHLTEQELDEIDRVIQTHTANLKIYAAKAKEREKQLSESSCIKNIPKNVVKFTGINGVCKALWITGAILQYLETSHPTKSISLGITIVGAVADIISAGYGSKIGVDFNDTMQLIKLDEKTQGAAENCRLFIERFKEIKKISTSNPIVPALNPNVQIINIEHTPPETLDALSKACMQVYEELPAKYRPDTGRDQVISVLIQTYPRYDSLQRGLRSLPHYNSNSNLTAIASSSQPAEPSSLHSSNSSNHAVKSDSDEIKQASLEATGPLPFSYINSSHNPSNHPILFDGFGQYEERRPSPTPAILDPEKEQLIEQQNWDKKIRDYSELVIQRLGLKYPPKNIIAFN
jgi:hypothetical protein